MRSHPSMTGKVWTIWTLKYMSRRIFWETTRRKPRRSRMKTPMVVTLVCPKSQKNLFRHRLSRVQASTRRPNSSHGYQGRSTPLLTRRRCVNPTDKRKLAVALPSPPLLPLCLLSSLTPHSQSPAAKLDFALDLRRCLQEASHANGGCRREGRGLRSLTLWRWRLRTQTTTGGSVSKVELTKIGSVGGLC
eukprot:Lithocolla_globosa_v1_NODE_1058_length_2905_cov_16.696491.p3 type:complete len:190 gc:universal NODE_1058_length_2905_cov_16.696491:563-1132(+)